MIANANGDRVTHEVIASRVKVLGKELESRVKVLGKQLERPLVRGKHEHISLGKKFQRS